MSTRLGNINLFVHDVQKARDFYIQALGLVENVERSHPPSFALLQAGDCTVTLQDANVPSASFAKTESIELGFEVDDIAATQQRLKDAGATISEQQQMVWGGGFDAFDLDGHRLTIYKMHEEQAS
ncbi:MAG: VOC family protein [Anaerolineae bacterium]|nr:VOC family protein [Anaerolineae bacterium]